MNPLAGLALAAMALGCVMFGVEYAQDGDTYPRFVAVLVTLVSGLMAGGTWGGPR